MGMFDRVWAECPVCGGRVEFQSKGGDCTLADYDADDVPMNVAGDCDVGHCDSCGMAWGAAIALPATVRIVPTRGEP